jgi:hypothetical protein
MSGLLHLTWRRRNWSRNDNPDSYYGGAWFEFGNYIGYWQYLPCFPTFLQTYAGVVPRLDHDRFLPNRFQVIIHQSSYHPTPKLSLNYLRRRITNCMEQSPSDANTCLRNSLFVTGLEGSLASSHEPKQLSLIIHIHVIHVLTLN